jgi:hypothetical protein
MSYTRPDEHSKLHLRATKLLEDQPAVNGGGLSNKHLRPVLFCVLWCVVPRCGVRQSLYMYGRQKLRESLIVKISWQKGTEKELEARSWPSRGSTEATRKEAWFR